MKLRGITKQGFERLASLTKSGQESEEGETVGSGWGEFQPGKRITEVEDLKSGELYLVHNTQFNADNVVLISEPKDLGFKRDLVYGIFIDPENLDRSRLSDDYEFAIWGVQLEQDEFYEAV